MTIRPGTQVYAVFKAVKDGWVNAPDIAQEVGIAKDKVAAYLAKLTRGGLIQRTHRHWGSFHHERRGRRFHLYAPADDRALRFFPSGAIRSRQ
jgi:predicted transcriptional regulator